MSHPEPTFPQTPNKLEEICQALPSTGHPETGTFPPPKSSELHQCALFLPSCSLAEKMMKRIN